MAAIKPAAGKPGLEEEGSQIHRIRITLTSRNVKNLEKGVSGSWYSIALHGKPQVLLIALAQCGSDLKCNSSFRLPQFALT